MIHKSGYKDESLFNLWLSRYHLASVAVADTIGLFGAVASGADSIEKVANMLGLEPNGIDALVCLLASLNLLIRDKDLIMPTQTIQNYLVPCSDTYWGEVFTYTHDVLEYKVILNALQCKNNVEKSTQMSENGVNFADMWGNGHFEEKSAKKFRNIMHSTMYTPAIGAMQSGIFKPVKHLLDIGGGSGCFANLLVKTYPEKKATIFELPTICNLTEEYLKKEKVIDKIQLCSGNFFIDEFPKGADGILFSNILHDWKKEQAQFLIDKAYSYLSSGDQIFIHEILLNEAKNGPLNAATFNLFMYANYKSQQFTKTELFAMLELTGFNRCVVYNTHQDYSIIHAVK